MLFIFGKTHVTKVNGGLGMIGMVILDNLAYWGRHLEFWDSQ